MFIDEAKIAVQLNHANIAQIFDLGVVDDSYFIALEYVHGRDLRAIFDRCRQRGEPMPIAQACFIMMKVCEGLDYAHNKRDRPGRELHLVHRDVSPQNVLIVVRGRGQAHRLRHRQGGGQGVARPRPGILKGKFGYMSPEQVRGLPIDRRSDIFSCGIVLYELLTGERLFVGESDFSTLEKVRNVEILPPSTYNRKIPDELERIVLRRSPRIVEDRYQNAIDLHDELQAFVYTAGEFYSRKDLAAWMKKTFGQRDRGGDGEARELSPAQGRRPRRRAGRARDARTPTALEAAGVPSAARRSTAAACRRRRHDEAAAAADAAMSQQMPAVARRRRRRPRPAGEAGRAQGRRRASSRGTTTSSRPRSTTTPRTIRSSEPQPGTPRCRAPRAAGAPIAPPAATPRRRRAPARRSRMLRPRARRRHGGPDLSSLVSDREGLGDPPRAPNGSAQRRRPRRTARRTVDAAAAVRERLRQGPSPTAPPPLDRRTRRRCPASPRSRETAAPVARSCRRRRAVFDPMASFGSGMLARKRRSKSRSDRSYIAVGGAAVAVSPSSSSSR